MRVINSMCRSWCFLTTLLLLTVMPLAIAAPTTEPVSKQDGWWQDRNAAVNERVKEGDVDMLFIGDSITHGWEGAGKSVWAQYYADRKAVNMGFSGDRTEHVLWRLENGHLEGLSPKLAMIMIGTNNHGDNTAEEITAGVNAIVEKLRTTCPNMRILLLAIFPRTDVDRAIQKRLKEATAAFAVSAASDPMITFLDVNRAFLDRRG
ncbi:MAG: hypothetical protein KAH38_06100, partial [Candidatus Hydrogenedentes bacterium]|nr:hypothetical protein [Candidatus Hydrogenedentota bacterium]